MEDATPVKSDELPAALWCRRQLPEDEPFLWQVYASTRQEELNITGWSPEERKIFLDFQFQAMRAGYASQFPQGEFSVVMLGEQRIGLMVVDRPENELRLVDIALLPEYRGRGIGSFYLKKLASEAALVRKPLRLHVFKGSRPWRLYERLGFVKIGDDGPYEHLEWCPPGEHPVAPDGPPTPAG